MRIQDTVRSPGQAEGLGTTAEATTSVARRGEPGRTCRKASRGERESMSCFVKSLTGEINTVLCKDRSPVKAGEGRARGASEGLQKGSLDCSCEG